MPLPRHPQSCCRIWLGSHRALQPSTVCRASRVWRRQRWVLTQGGHLAVDHGHDMDERPHVAGSEDLPGQGAEPSYERALVLLAQLRRSLRSGLAASSAAVPPAAGHSENVRQACSWPSTCLTHAAPHHAAEGASCQACRCCSRRWCTRHPSARCRGSTAEHPAEADTRRGCWGKMRSHLRELDDQLAAQAPEVPIEGVLQQDQHGLQHQPAREQLRGAADHASHIPCALQAGAT